MIRSFRAYFLSRALREKLLLVAFVAIGVAWWGSAFTTRLGKFWQEKRSTTSRLREQTEWIKNKTIIEDAAKKTASSLDSARTLNSNLLVAKVQQIAADVGLGKQASTSGIVPTTRSGQFAIHSADYLIRNADWETLSKFYEALQQQAPYIAVEKFTLTASPNNDAQLTLQLRVVSFEIVVEG
jgi:hypothetical protein